MEGRERHGSADFLQAGYQHAELWLEVEDELERFALIGVQGTRNIKSGSVLEQFREHRVGVGDRERPSKPKMIRMGAASDGGQDG